MVFDSNAITGEEMEEEQSTREDSAATLPPISSACVLDLDGTISDNDPVRTPTSELSSLPSLVHTPAVSWTSEDLNMLSQALPSQDLHNGHPLIKPTADCLLPISQNTDATDTSRAIHKASTPPAPDENLICIRRNRNSTSQSPEPRFSSLTTDFSTQAVIGPTSFSQPARLKTHMRRRRDGPEYSTYLNQTFVGPQSQHYLPNYQPHPLRTRSSHPSQGTPCPTITPRSRAYSALPSGAKTLGNTPTQSPGLFTPTTKRHNILGDESEESPYHTPMLHPTHLQKPKETHKLLKDYNPISGRKVVNNYEFLEKLGSGQHGTVKLGRQVGFTKLVAIKIVRRFSKKLRLGKFGDPNDMIKKEVAILKKARHEHVVSLLEVIDDDEFGKVYLVLEFVERGEIVWRKKTDKYIAVFEMERVKREKLQQVDAAYEEDERRKFNASVGCRRKEKLRLLEQQKMQALEVLKSRAEERRRSNLVESPFWSLEYATDLEEELVVETFDEVTTAPLGPSTPIHSETPETPRPLLPAYPQLVKISDQRSHDLAFQSTLDQIIATESAWTPEQEEFMQVPCLTISQALDAFRDTVLGLEYLHYQGIIHRDIKPANLLWTSDRRVKISDFGVSYLGKPIREDDNNEERAEADADDLDESIELAKTVGTPAFYAPELCDPELFDLSKDPDRPLITGQIDVWALGVTLFAMIFGRLPFFDVNEFAMYEKIARQEVFIPRLRLKGVENVEADSAMKERTERVLGELRSTPNTNPEEIRMLEALRQENSIDDSMTMDKRFDDILEYEEVDDDLRDLLKRLLDKQPLKRINIKEVKRHPWVLRGIVDKSAWIDKTDPSVQSQGRKIEVSREEVQEAVVEVSASISLVDRTFDHIKSTFRRLGSVVRGRPVGRKRRNSNSNAVEKTVYNSVSNGRGNSPNGRRSSLRGDERYSVPHATREASGNSLSQSVVAIAELKFGRSRLDGNRDLLYCSHGPTDRPTFLERTPSNAESTKTIKSCAHSIIPEVASSLGEVTSSSMNSLTDSPLSSSLGAFGRRFLNNMSISRQARSGKSASQSSRSSSVENRSQITSSIESLHLFQSRGDRRPGSHYSHTSSHRRRTICSTADLSCPPDSDPIFRERQASFSHSDDAPPIAVSSSSDQIASGMSESTSHPSIASVVSGASSLSMATEEYQSLLKNVSNPSTVVSKSPRSVLAPDDIVDHLSALNIKTEGDDRSIDDDEAGYNGEGELDSDSDEGIEIGRRRSKH